MASFTDNPSILGNFNPYIETLPASDLATVGMIKQQEFDKGVSIVQGYVDSLSGLPIAKAEIKAYVQTKLGQLKEGVTKNLSGDFSDHRVVNQIGGAAKLIARDPIVQNGVTSTARMQTSMGELAEAKKAGKSSVQNEAHLQNSINEWINDGKLDSPFSGSYTPYVDVIDKFIKLYKEQNAGHDIPQDAFRYDPNAVTKDNPEGRVINPVLFKGKSAEKVQALFNTIASQPDVQAQLGIDGWYKYRGVTQNQLGQTLTDSTTAVLDNNKKAIQTLEAKLALGPSDAPVLSAQLEELKRQDISKRKSYDQIIGVVKSNPEAAKVQLAKDELANNLMNAYSYQIMEKSPLWETSMQQKTFDRELYEWQATFDQNERKFEWDKYKDNETLKIAREKAEKEKKDAGGNDVVVSGQITSDEIPKGSAAAYANLDASADEYGQAMFHLVAFMDHGGENSPVVLDNVTGRYVYNYGKGKKYETKEAAADAVSVSLKAAKDKYMNGGIGNREANTLMEAVNQKWDNYRSNGQIITDVEGNFKTQLEAVGITAANDDYAKRVIVEKQLPGWQSMQQHLISKYGPDYDKGMGIGTTVQGAEGGGFIPGENYDKYKKMSSLINDNSSLILKNREEEFTRRNITNIPYTVTHDTDKPENRNNVNRRFNALAAARAVNPSTGKGDPSKILSLTEGKSDKEYEANTYRSGINPQTGIAYIQIQRGNDSPVTMEISRAEYEKQFPERMYNNQFRETYGARLNQTKWTSTGEDRTNAYKVMPDKPDSPLVVQYHLVVQGPNQYAMRLWVTPKPTTDDESPTPIINGEYASGTLVGMPDTLTEEEVIKWRDKLRDSNWLRDQLLFKFKPKPQ